MMMMMMMMMMMTKMTWIRAYNVFLMATIHLKDLLCLIRLSIVKRSSFNEECPDSRLPGMVGLYFLVYQTRANHSSIVVECRRRRRWRWIRQFLRCRNTAHAVTRAPWQKSHVSEVWLLEIVCFESGLERFQGGRRSHGCWHEFSAQVSFQQKLFSSFRFLLFHPSSFHFSCFWVGRLAIIFA